MIENNKKSSKTGKVRVNHYVVNNVVCKKLVKNEEKWSKTGKVRVKLHRKPVVLNNFLSKSENNDLNKKREYCKRSTLNQEVRTKKNIGSKKNNFYELNQFYVKM